MEKPEKKSVIDTEKLKLKRDGKQSAGIKKEEGVSQGDVGIALNLAFNSTPEKIREVTIIDRMQGRLLPQLDLVNDVWNYVFEIAIYRQDSEQYKKLFVEENKVRPIPPKLIDQFIYRTAQWQKSVFGKNLERISDIALAQIETQGDDDFGDPNKDPWKKTEYLKDLLKGIMAVLLTFFGLFGLAKGGVVRMLAPEGFVETAYKIIDTGFSYLVYILMIGCIVAGIWMICSYINNRGKPKRLSEDAKAIISAIHSEFSRFDIKPEEDVKRRQKPSLMMQRIKR